MKTAAPFAGLFRRVLLISFAIAIFFAGVSARAGNIFDDNWTPPTRVVPPKPAPPTAVPVPPLPVTPEPGTPEPATPLPTPPTPPTVRRPFAARFPQSPIRTALGAL